MRRERFIRIFVMVGVVYYMVACGSSQNGNVGYRLGDTQTLTGGFDEALQAITEKSLKDNLYYLASEELQGRGSGAPGGDKAAAFIAQKYKEFGLQEAYPNSYYQYFDVKGDKKRTQNVIGVLPGNDPVLKDQVIVIGAHYDHLGMRSDAEDSDDNGNNDDGNDSEKATIYYGADDNGSGTVAVIESAKAFSMLKGQNKRTIVFIAFSGEEMGLIGSSYYVKNPLFPINKTVYMLNQDMIGYLRDGNLDFLGGGSSQDAAKAMRDICKKYPDITPDITQSAGGGSDHVPFMNRKVPGVFVHTGSTSVYHTPSDTREKVNYQGLTEVTKIAFELGWVISQKSAAPTETYEAITITKRDLEYDHEMMPFIK